MQLCVRQYHWLSNLDPLLHSEHCWVGCHLHFHYLHLLHRYHHHLHFHLWDQGYQPGYLHYRHLLHLLHCHFLHFHLPKFNVKYFLFFIHRRLHSQLQIISDCTMLMTRWIFRNKIDFICRLYDIK